MINVKCTICGADLLLTEARFYGSIGYCLECANDSLFLCHRCHSWRTEESLACDDTWSDHWDNEIIRMGTCVHCVQPQDSPPVERDGVQGYGYKPKAIFRCTKDERLLAVKRRLTYYGFENEVEYLIPRESQPRDPQPFAPRIGCSQLHPYARTLAEETGGLLYCKYDSTIKHGFEIVSHPFTVQWYLKNRDSAFQPMFDLDGHFSDAGNCGMHVHISKNGITRAQLYKMAYFAVQNREFVRRISRRTEEKLNSWSKLPDGRSKCVRMACYPGHPKILKDKDKWYRDWKGGSPSGRGFLNSGPSRTIEMRLFRSTLDRVEFHRQLQFTMLLTEFAKVASMAKGGLTVDAFHSFIDGDKFPELKEFTSKHATKGKKK